MKRTFWKKALMFLATTAVSVSVGIAAYADETDAAELNSLLQLAEEETSKVVQLNKDYDITGATRRVEVSGNVTLDLNGHEIKAASTIPGNILVSGTLTLKDSGTTGRIYTETNYTAGSADKGVIYVDRGTFNMESGTIYAVRPDAADNGQFGVYVGNAGTVNISGGRIEAGWYAVSGNGNDISGTTINVSGGELISETDYAIYHPQAGTLNITNGLVTGGAGGIVMNRGTLKISGGTIASAGSGDTGNWGDGTGGLSDYAVKLNAAYGNVNATISGGKFVAGMEAVCVGGGTNGTVEVSVTGGEFSDPSIFGLNPTGNINVKLNKDYTGNVDIPAGVTATLDLNGKTLTGRVVSKGDLTIKDSTATSEPVVNSDYEGVTYSSGKIICNDHEEQAVLASENGTVTIESGWIDSAGDGIYACSNKTGADGMNPVVNIKGGYILAQEYGASAQGKGAELNISGGVVVAKDNAAVAGNGSMPPENDYLSGTVMNISGGTMISHIQSKGYIACGVYHPQGGYLNITGGTIYADGGVGVLVRAGEVKISDNATIVATGNSSGKVGDSKVIANCYAVQVDKESNYPGCSVVDAKVEISGGTIKSDATCLDVLPKQNDTTKRIVVSGGQFSNDVQTYCADGYFSVPNDDKTEWSVQQKKRELVVKMNDISVENGKEPVFTYAVAGLATGDKVTVNPVCKYDSTVAGTYKIDATVTDTPVYYETPAVVSGALTVLPKPGTETGTTDTVVVPEAPKVDESANPSAEAKKVAKNLQVDEEAVALNGVEVAKELETSGKAMKQAEEKLADVRAEGDTILLVVKPYVEIKPTTIETSADGKVQKVNLEITMKYDVQATIPGKKTVKISTGNTMSKEQIKADTTITVPVPTGFATTEAFVRHVTGDNNVYYYSTKLTDGKFEFTVPAEHGFSPFTLMSNSNVTVKLDGKDYTYTSLDVVNGTALPAASKFNYAFKGWKFEGIDGQYFNMTAELFEALLDKNAVVIGSSVFEGPMSEHPEIEEAKKNGTWGVDDNKPAATAKPAAAAAVTPVRSSIPKTSDDSNLMLWVCLMGIAALGLGGAVYMKKRNHQ